MIINMYRNNINSLAKLAPILLAILVVFSLLFMFGSELQAQNALFPECNDPAAAASPVCEATKDPAPGSDTALFGPNSLLSRITEVLIRVAGAVAILMIVIGGLRYVISNGDPQATGNAKNTILYAVIGLVIALAAEAILKLVLQRL